MKMYLVRRYVDEKPDGEYGVCDSNYLVGLFTDEAVANAVKEKAEAEAKLIDFNEQYDCHKTEIDIIEIEVNRIYEAEEQIYLGGGFYIE